MVEWKKLSDVAVIKNGKDYKKLSNGNIPVFGTGGIMTYVDQFASDKPSVLLPRKGSVENIFYVDEPFWTVDTLYWTDIDTSKIDPKFLFVSLQRYNLKEFAYGGARPSLSQQILYNLDIPLPSLSEQKRIVGILDTFTASIDNLKEQIAQRRKQYEYYRDQLYYANKSDLLEASKRGEAIVKSLDELGTFTRGRRFVRTDIVPEGVPCIHYGDMYTYYGVSAEETPTHLTKELSSKLRFAKYGDVVIVAAGENDLDIGVGVAWLGNEPVVVHDACFIFEHKMNPKYLSHFMRSRNYHQQIRMGVVDGKICSISAKELGRALIAVPSLQEQQRIVSILDTFEASIQNLEAQLSQREKQYEYYRNKLLKFE